MYLLLPKFDAARAFDHLLFILGPVTAFLNWRVFAPLSRLTYSAYLVHIYVLYWYGYTQDQPLHFLNQNMVYIYLGKLSNTSSITGKSFAVMHIPQQLC